MRGGERGKVTAKAQGALTVECRNACLRQQSDCDFVQRIRTCIRLHKIDLGPATYHHWL